MASSLVVLIPKSEHPNTFADFRPICLSNFVNKVCTKVLATRLIKILPKIISIEQAGFMQNKDVIEQVLIAQEMLHSIDKKIRGSNVMVKLDMAKAFNKLFWEFLALILDRFGFSNNFVHLIMNNLKATHLSILVNGALQGFFQPKRGVKHGDPLSPFFLSLLLKPSLEASSGILIMNLLKLCLWLLKKSAFQLLTSKKLKRVFSNDNFCLN
ncbi:unnamed protein product [Cuscuta epithymum]|uniref:Reverse transcriptase domain-containing protein n=1 Tax=Cuscuta epithymum TaxID=186058 RepID=A0AAV0ENA1_9ASTE|nr:unnamed protein product [Cuscuta epithymum]